MVATNLPGTANVRPKVHLRVAGSKLDVGGGGTHQHIDPTTGQFDAQIPLAGKADVARAVEAAHAAFESWRLTRPAERQRLLLRLADLMDAHIDDLGRAGTMDNGTPFNVARGTCRLAVDWTRYYAGWADKIAGELSTSYAMAGELNYTLLQPYGVVGVVVTWNTPLMSLAMKLPAALAAGNTAVVKPSELTPFSGELFMDLVEEAGIPDGVINVLPGAREAGEALVAHPLVRKISFTGGPATAKAILHACAEHVKPVVMELGGKSANLVFEDADLDSACVSGVYGSIGLLSGQGCSFPTRMLVQESVYDEVVELAAEAARGFRVGDPWERGTQVGPVINAAAVERILEMIERAQTDGARLVAGGSRVGGALAEGYFVEPTVFADVDPQSELAQSEVFGPVLAITPFSDDADAIRIANSTAYGLSGNIQTKDLSRALRIAEELITGEVRINGAELLRVQRPFGGVLLSGYGREGGRHGLEEFLWVKGVGIA